MTRSPIVFSILLALSVVSVSAAQKDYDKAQAKEAVNAITSGNMTRAKELVNAGLPATAQGGYGVTLLFAAAQEGREEMVRFLVERGADPNRIAVYGQSAMHAALDHPSLLKDMVELGGDPNLASKDGQTLLMSAASNSRPEAVRALLDLKADPLLADQKGKNALFYTMSNKEKYVDSIFTLLVERGVPIDRVDNEGNTLLMKAASWGRLKPLETLIAQGQPMWATNKKGESVLDMLAGGGMSRQHIADMLLAKKPPKPLLQHALGSTLKSGEYWMTEKMINAGARLDDPQLLFLALEGGSWDSLRQLLGAGLDPKVHSAETGKTPLQSVVSDGKVELARLLLQYGADIGSVEADDLYASGMLYGDEEQQELAELLIAAGLDPKLEIEGESLRDYLSHNEQPELATLFGNSTHEGCMATSAPLADARLSALREQFVGTWQKQGDDNVGLTLGADGKAVRTLEFFGMKREERGTWELKGSHLVLLLSENDNSSRQQLGVHCIESNHLRIGNDSEAMRFTRVAAER
jgi:uncharacterized protein